MSNFIPLSRDLEGNYFAKRNVNTWHMLINDALAIVTIGMSLYIIFYPLIPELKYQITPKNHSTKLYKGKLSEDIIKKSKQKISATNPESQNLIQQLVSSVLSEPAESDELPIPKENTLVIPKIGGDGELYEGNGTSALAKGFWRRPKSSTPNKGGNTVIVAHRFLYTSGPKTFYNLDKMEVGDRFAIYWEGVEYNYEVYDISIVPPTATEIEGDTVDPIVTLYTCTPIWTAKDRLVVKARLI